MGSPTIVAPHERTGVFDYIFNPTEPPPYRAPTRAERIERARKLLEDCRTSRDKASVTRRRRELTREVLYQRVELGDPVAQRRWVWIQRADTVRGRIREASQVLGFRAADAASLRARLASGCSEKGTPYATGTINGYTSRLKSLERDLTEGPEEIRQYLLASVPPPYHVWRRSLGLHVEQLPGNVIPIGRRRRNTGKSEITIGDGA